MSPHRGRTPLPAAVALRGRFWRHQPHSRPALSASWRGGRYSPPREFEAIYLGRPVASVAGEAYRHLVDPFEVDPAMLDSRWLFEVAVELAAVLDLREQRSRRAVGLSKADLAGEHGPCQVVGRRAYEAGYQGVIAPAATGLGETLCVFCERAGAAALRVAERRLWELPADPRKG